MESKKKTWPEIKRSKSPEEWKRLRKAYGSRRTAKNALHKEAQELIERIYTSPAISDEGLAKDLRREVMLALRLPGLWMQKEYDEASRQLAEAKRAVEDFAGRSKKVNVDLLDAILVSFRLSDVPAEEKLAVLFEAMLRIGNGRKTAEITGCNESLPEFVYALCKQTPGFYPEWFPKIYAQQGLALLTKEDRDKVIKMFQADVQNDKDMEFLANMLNPDSSVKENIELF